MCGMANALGRWEIWTQLEALIGQVSSPIDGDSLPMKLTRDQALGALEGGQVWFKRQGT